MKNLEIPEVWKPVVGFESHYDVSNHGHVRAIWRKWHIERRDEQLCGKILKTQIDKLGYERIKLRRDGKTKVTTVHILVLAAFRGPRPQGHSADHLDGNRSNNKLNNLEYCTHAENVRRSDIRNGGRPWNKGEGNPNATLTEEKVRAIRRLAGEGATFQELADKYDISPKHAYKIVRREKWQWVT